MKKLLSIAVVVALMLWFPILAQAKDFKKDVKHHKHWRPFVSLQEQINDLEETVYGVYPGSGLQEQIDAIQLSIDAIEEQLGSSGSSGSYYTVVGSTVEVPLGSEVFEVETVCNPDVSGQHVMSGGYDLRLLPNEYEIPEQFPFYTMHVIGQGPNSTGDGWKVRVVNYSGLGATVKVTAVCFGQAPAN